MSGFSLQELELDLPALSAAFIRRLRSEGLPVTADHAARFAEALTLVRPVSRHRLYFTARVVLVSDPTQMIAFDRVFTAVFGPRADDAGPNAVDEPEQIEPALHDERDAEEHGSERPPLEQLVPTLAGEEEVLRGKRFDALEPAELAALAQLMARLRIATPRRRTRRFRADRHGERIDLRRTLRDAGRTAGEPIRLARRRRRAVSRRLVLLCDISGSMEPYARAYLQFLAVAAGTDGRAEAFVFATRLTRLTRAMRTRSPERAIARAAEAAPDWSSGTRIGEALHAFNDRHGRRGMARGAIVVILSDGWERGDPALVGREMARLGRLAHRIVWVNPRLAASGFEPRAGGMAAALPYCDALVSGHRFDALGEVIDAIAGDGVSRGPAGAPEALPEPDDEPWGSATPVPGSSVAMPSGYGPSRGRTTPGWGGR